MKKALLVLMKHNGISGHPLFMPVMLLLLLFFSVIPNVVVLLSS